MNGELMLLSLSQTLLIFEQLVSPSLADMTPGSSCPQLTIKYLHVLLESEVNVLEQHVGDDVPIQNIS